MEEGGFVGMVDLGVFAVTLLCPFVTISFSCEPASSFYPSCVLKFRYSEKATKIWKNLALCFDIIMQFQKKVGDFLKILWPSYNT
jgi:hypothetical protein